jgi:hypothetical protein
LGADPPHALAEPIVAAPAQPRFTPQSSHIHPVIDGKDIGYFDWVGAATHVADRYSSAMHGKVMLLDTGYAGIDDENLYCRLDFMESPQEWAGEDMRLLVTMEAAPEGIGASSYRLEATIAQGRISGWTFAQSGNGQHAFATDGISVCLDTIFECQIPLELLGATQGSLLRVRFSLWRDQLPLDALPQEGSIELRVASESELSAVPYAKP